MRGYPGSLAWGDLDPETLPEVNFQPHGYLFLATKVLIKILRILMMNQATDDEYKKKDNDKDNDNDKDKDEDILRTPPKSNPRDL